MGAILTKWAQNAHNFAVRVARHRFWVLQCGAILGLSALAMIYMRARPTSMATLARPVTHSTLVSVFPANLSGTPEGALSSTAIDEALHAFLIESGLTVVFTSGASGLPPLARTSGAQDLGAFVVLSASVHHQGNELYTIIVATDSKGHKQTRTSRRSLSDDLAGQVDAAVAEVARLLHYQGHITPSVYRSLSPSAYTLYVTGRQTVTEHPSSKEELLKAISLYEASAKADPTAMCTSLAEAEADLHMYQVTHNTSWVTQALATLSARRTPQAINCVYTRYRLSQLLSDVGEGISALSLLQQLSRRLPEADQVNRDLAYAYLSLGMYHEAIHESLAAVVHNSKQVENYNALGMAYLGGARYKAAIGAFTYALTLGPARASTLNSLAAAYLYTGASSRSIELFREVVLLAPSANTHSNLGTAYFYQGDLHASAIEYRQALLLSPGSEECMGNLATALRLLGHARESRDLFLRAIALARRDVAAGAAVAHREEHIALYQAQVGKFNTAYRMIAAARNLDPSSVDVLRAQLIIEVLARDLPRALVSASQLLEQGFPLYLIQANPNLRRFCTERGFVELIGKRADSTSRSR